MKRLIILCLTTLLLLCSCSFSNADFRPVASPDSFEGKEDFACAITIGAEETHLKGEAAVQLYAAVCKACANSETTIATQHTGETITLIFYTGGADTSSSLTPYLQPDAISFGRYVFRSDDVAQYSDHVLVSHSMTFLLKEGAYDEIRALAEQLMKE